MEEDSQENVVNAQEENEEEEELTAQVVLQALENAWLNEKFAPEILPHQSELIECMLQQISHMEQNLERLSKDDIRIAVHGLELARIRFVISSYLRTRVEKIERYTVHILSEEAKRSSDEAYLTPAEFKFAKDYLSSIEILFKTIALQHMPTNFQTFEVNKMRIKPNMNTHVFLRAKKRITGVTLPGTTDEEVDFDAGSQHIIQYSAVADLVKNGDVQLI